MGRVSELISRTGESPKRESDAEISFEDFGSKQTEMVIVNEKY